MRFTFRENPKVSVKHEEIEVERPDLEHLAGNEEIPHHVSLGQNEPDHLPHDAPDDHSEKEHESDEPDASFRRHRITSSIIIHRALPGDKP